MNEFLRPNLKNVSGKDYTYCRGTFDAGQIGFFERECAKACTELERQLDQAFRYYARYSEPTLEKLNKRTQKVVKPQGAKKQLWLEQRNYKINPPFGINEGEEKTESMLGAAFIMDSQRQCKKFIANSGTAFQSFREGNNGFTYIDYAKEEPLFNIFSREKVFNTMEEANKRVNPKGKKRTCAAQKILGYIGKNFSNKNQIINVFIYEIFYIPQLYFTDNRDWSNVSPVNSCEYCKDIIPQLCSGPSQPKWFKPGYHTLY